MAEESVPVKVFEVQYRCDKCRRGYMVPTGVCLTSHPPQWPHSCTCCGANAVFSVQYPHHRYEEIDWEED